MSLAAVDDGIIGSCLMFADFESCPVHYLVGSHGTLHTETSN